MSMSSVRLYKQIHPFLRVFSFSSFSLFFKIKQLHFRLNHAKILSSKEFLNFWIIPQAGLTPHTSHLFDSNFLLISRKRQGDDDSSCAKNNFTGGFFHGKFTKAAFSDDSRTGGGVGRY